MWVEDNMQNATTGAPREKDPGDGGGDEKEAATVNVNVDMTGMAEVIREATTVPIATVQGLMRLADREQPAPTIHVEPHIALDVRSKNGKTTTHVRGYDEKGRITLTETVPEDDDD
jgi:hypothetical protein